MPRRSVRERKPGTIIKLCQCGKGIQSSNVCCRRCWVSTPLRLRSAYLAARSGDEAGLERAAEAIRKHLREAVRA